MEKNQVNYNLKLQHIGQSPGTTVAPGSAFSDSKQGTTTTASIFSSSKKAKPDTFIHRLSKLNILNQLKGRLSVEYRGETSKFDRKGEKNRSSQSKSKFAPVDEEEPDSKNGELSLVIRGKDPTRTSIKEGVQSTEKATKPEDGSTPGETQGEAALKKRP